MYGVKYDLDTLADAAAARGANVALFGHTHICLLYTSLQLLQSGGELIGDVAQLADDLDEGVDVPHTGPVSYTHLSFPAS